MKAYLSFIIALIIDTALFPLFSAAWLPYLSLAVLPAVMLYASRRTGRILVGIEALTIWLTTGINLGIVILAMGLFVLFEEWFIGRFFRTETWQTLVIAALGLVVPGIVLVVYGVLSPEVALSVFSVFSIRLLSTIIIAIGVAYSVYAKA